MLQLRLLYRLTKTVRCHHVYYCRACFSCLPSASNNTEVHLDSFGNRSSLPLDCRKEIAEMKGRELRDLINSTHEQLRNQWKTGSDVEQAWSEHTSNKELLKRYAAAIIHRQGRFEKKEPWVTVPEWIHKQLQHYFREGGRERRRVREQEEAAQSHPHLIKPSDTSNTAAAATVSSAGEGSRLRVLDVGSCYNPFKEYSDLDVTALDLYPATTDTFQCDFLKLKITEPDEMTSSLPGVDAPEVRTVLPSQDSPSRSSKTITSLPANSFDAVIFSSMLSYMACPEQRLLCCKLAYRLIKEEGVLVVAELDLAGGKRSDYVFQTWDIALSSLGFSRAVFRKTDHFFGMLFRKGFYPEGCKLTTQSKLEKMKKRKKNIVSAKVHTEVLHQRNQDIEKFDLDKTLTGLFLWHNIADVHEEVLDERKDEKSISAHLQQQEMDITKQTKFSWDLKSFVERIRHWIRNPAITSNNKS